MWALVMLALLIPGALYAQAPAEPSATETQTIRETVTVTAPAPPYSVAYTRSRLMDDASSVFDASVTGPVASYPVADSFNRRLERDYSNGDIPHVLVAHAIWEIPRSGGITMSAITALEEKRFFS